MKAENDQLSAEADTANETIAVLQRELDRVLGSTTSENKQLRAKVGQLQKDKETMKLDWKAKQSQLEYLTAMLGLEIEKELSSRDRETRRLADAYDALDAHSRDRGRPALSAPARSGLGFASNRSRG